LEEGHWSPLVGESSEILMESAALMGKKMLKTIENNFGQKSCEC
jgi:hypothetical protein